MATESKIAIAFRMAKPSVSATHAQFFLQWFGKLLTGDAQFDSLEESALVSPCPTSKNLDCSDWE